MKCLDQLIACNNFLLFKKMMIQRNTRLNQAALQEIMDQGNEVPETVNMQALYDAEEAELQRAIEESKAMMELMQIAQDDEKNQAAQQEEPEDINPQSSRIAPAEIEQEKEEQESLKQRLE